MDECTCLLNKQATNVVSQVRILLLPYSQVKRAREGGAYVGGRKSGATSIPAYLGKLQRMVVLAYLSVLKTVMGAKVPVGVRLPYHP